MVAAEQVENLKLEMVTELRRMHDMATSQRKHADDQSAQFEAETAHLTEQLSLAEQNIAHRQSELREAMESRDALQEDLTSSKSYAEQFRVDSANLGAALSHFEESMRVLGERLTEGK